MILRCQDKYVGCRLCCGELNLVMLFMGFFYISSAILPCQKDIVYISGHGRYFCECFSKLHINIFLIYRGHFVSLTFIVAYVV